jgi:prepilin-type N-terminal cleavage/methylation domain-containing protein
MAKAFTLIELLVVVAIIGILAAVGVVAYNGYINYAKISATTQNHFALVKLLSSKAAECQIISNVTYTYYIGSVQNSKTISCGAGGDAHIIAAIGQLNVNNPWDITVTQFSLNNDNFKPEKGRTNLSCSKEFTGSDNICRLTTNTGKDNSVFHLQSDISLKP